MNTGTLRGNRTTIGSNTHSLQRPFAFLLRFFIRGESARLPLGPRYFQNRTVNILILCFPIFIGGYRFVSHSRYVSSVIYGEKAEVPMKGIWFVERIEGVDMFPWTHLIFDRPTLLAVKNRDASIQLIKIEEIVPFQSLTLRRKAENWKTTFNIKETNQDTIQMVGDWYGKQVGLTLRRIDPEKFILFNRGFRWVNEVPYNEVH